MIKDQIILATDIVIAVLLILNVFLTIKSIFKGWRLWAVLPVPIAFLLIMVCAAILGFLSAPSSLFVLIVPPFMIGASVPLVSMAFNEPTPKNKERLLSRLKKYCFFKTK